MLTLNTAKWSNAEAMIDEGSNIDTSDAALHPSKTESAATCDMQKKNDPEVNGTYNYMNGPCLTQVDRVIIRSYFQENPGELPPQTAPLAHRGQLSRSFPAHPLPEALARKLSALPYGFERVMIGRQVFLIASHTRDISDVVHDIDTPVPNPAPLAADPNP